MSTARITEFISVDEYLEGERASARKHEYIAGRVYAIGGARNVHNLIASNTIVAIGLQLKRNPCRPFNSDTKLRIKRGRSVRFYYPDVSVVCEQNPLTDSFQDQPVVIIEVLSDSTRRLDVGEKQDAYFTIPSLRHYVLLEQDVPIAIVHDRSGDDFSSREFTRPDDVITLDALGISLSMRELYEGVAA